MEQRRNARRACGWVAGHAMTQPLKPHKSGNERAGIRPANRSTRCLANRLWGMWDQSSFRGFRHKRALIALTSCAAVMALVQKTLDHPAMRGPGWCPTSIVPAILIEEMRERTVKCAIASSRRQHTWLEGNYLPASRPHPEQLELACLRQGAI